MATEEKLEVGEAGLGLIDGEALAHIVEQELSDRGKLESDTALAAFRELQRRSEG